MANNGSDFSIVYIASRAHSGSTLLDLLLSGHSALTSVGEVKRLRHPRSDELITSKVAARTRCTCGAKSILQCDHWMEVEKVLVRDYGLRLVDLDLMTKDEGKFLAHNDALFRAVGVVSQKRFIVDSSKSPQRLEMLLEAGAFDVRPIHLIRHPLGQVNSVIKKDMDAKRACASYCQQHLKCSSILRGTDHRRVRYEALATRTAGEVTRLMEWLDLDFQQQQLEWTTGTRHNMGGNRTRFSKSSEIELDRSWRRELTPFQMAGIWLGTLPTLPIRWNA